MLKEALKKITVILASGSPRRQEFFKMLDIDFKIIVKDVEEKYPPHLQREEISNYLANLKADAFESLQDNELLVTSDTIVWHSNKALGKPKDRQDAINIIKQLAGDTHEVITSVCMRTTKKNIIFHDITTVTFNTMTEDEIMYYVDHYQPFDKAGAYGIQDWIGITAVSQINGSYANVMGLPVDKVYQQLKAFAHE